MEFERDEDLLPRVVEGDHQAFERLYQRYEALLRRHVERIVRDAEAADDLVQEALLRVWTRAEQYSGRSPFRAWLLRIATNLALNSLRSERRRRQCPLVIPAEPTDPDDQEIIVPSWMIDTVTPGPDVRFERCEQHQRLRALVGDLPESKREVVRLIYEAEMDVHSVAAALSVPEGTVKSRLHHATRNLARQLEESE